MAPHPYVTPKHYEGIGQVVVEWARLETAMIRVFGKLLNGNAAEAIVIFWHMAYRDRRDRLINLVLLNHEDPNTALRKEFDTLMTRMEAAYQIRNTAAHSVWTKGKGPDTISPTVIKAKGAPLKISGHNIDKEDFSARRFQKEAEKIERLGKDFREFFSANFGVEFPSIAKDSPD